MKKLLVLFLVSIFYNAHAAQEREASVNLNEKIFSEPASTTAMFNCGIDFMDPKTKSVKQTRTLDIAYRNMLAQQAILRVIRHPHNTHTEILAPHVATGVGSLLLQVVNKSISVETFLNTCATVYNVPPKQFADEVKDCIIKY